MANWYTSTSVAMHGAWQSNAEAQARQSNAEAQAWQANAAAQECGILNASESRSTSTEMLGAWQVNAAAQAGKSADPTRQLIMQQQQQQQQLVLAQQLQARYDQQLALHGLRSPSCSMVPVLRCVMSAIIVRVQTRIGQARVSLDRQTHLQRSLGSCRRSFLLSLNSS